MQLAVVDDDLFLKHKSPEAHPERPERLVAARKGLAASKFATNSDEQGAQPKTNNDASVDKPSVLRLTPRDATLDELCRVHDAAYLDELAIIRGRRGHLDGDTFFSEDSYQAMLRASGGALALTESVLSGECQYGFGLLRPPGHHARSGNAMGFCALNHVAVAARSAQALGKQRVLVLDWDVHHGNGTEEMFYEDPSVLYVSLHQYPQYPGTGRRQAVGTGDGKGFTLNVPLSSGADDTVYAEAFRRVVLPIVEQFAPDMTFVSAGYDAHRRDPLGGMALTAQGYAAMTSSLQKTLDPKAPIVFLLEGGYDLLAVEDSVKATLDALLEAPAFTAQQAAGRHEPELAAVIDVQRSYWSL